MVRKLALAVSIALGTVTVPAHALGLGDLDSKSGLNQAFDGRIPLLSVRPDEVEGLRVRLADADAFARAGIDRPYFLTLMRFEPTTDASGKPVVKVTSNFPIREPFLNFLVEVNWANGRLLREYTVLLDPPTRAAAAPVATRPATRPATTASRATSSARPATTSGAIANDDAYRVRANDTAWGIAQRIRPRGATMEQTMMALLETNPDAFINRNINLLKRGRILRLPSSDEILGLARQQARAAFRDQQDAWLEQRGARAAAPEAGAAAPEPIEPAEDQLRIATVEPETEVQPAPGTVPDAEQPVAEELQQMLISARENAESSRLEAEDLRARMDDLQSRLEDMKRLLNLKDDQLAQLQKQVLEPDAAGLDVAPAELPEPEVVEPAATVTDATDVTDAAADTGAEAPTDAEQPAPAMIEPPAVADAGEAPAVPEPTAPAVSTPMVDLPSISDFDMAPRVDPDAVVREAQEAASAQAVTPGPLDVDGSEPAAVEQSTPATEGPLQRDAAAPLAGSPEPDGPGADAPVADDGEAANGSSAAMASLKSTLENYSVPLGIGAVLLMGLIGFAATRGRRESADDVAPAVAGPGVAPGVATAAAAAASASDRVDARPEPRDVAPSRVDSDSVLPDELQAAIADLGDDSDIADAASQLDNLQDETGEVDPVSEADVYIAYGRYQQAKELLYQALAREPDRLALKHKLLEVHYATRDSKEFVSLAQQMSDAGQDTVDAASWDRAVEMGRELDPRHPLFAAAAGVASVDALMQTGEEDSSTLLDPDSLSNKPDSALAALEADQLEAPSEISILLDDTDTSESVTVEDELPDSISIDELDSLEFEPPEPRRPEGTAKQDESLEDDSLSDSLDLSAILDESVTTEPVADDTLDPVFTAEELQAQLDALSDLTSLDDSSLEEPTRPLASTDEAGLGLVKEDVSGRQQGLDQPLDLSEAFDSQTLGDGDDSLEIAADSESTTTEDTVTTKLDLARAYVEMGDADGARGILNEVMTEGDAAQRAEAQRLIDSLA